jgi:type III secretory pathway component EscV
MNDWKYNALLVLIFLFLVAWLVFPLPEQMNRENILFDIAAAAVLVIVAFVLYKKWMVKSLPNAA